MSLIFIMIQIKDLCNILLKFTVLTLKLITFDKGC